MLTMSRKDTAQLITLFALSNEAVIGANGTD